jgi:two-component system response regulator YesN
LYKVLIVDDESWVLENYRLGIDWASRGFEVVDTASNGMEALDKIRQIHPDLVLTDIRMPVMGGLVMIRQAKQMFPDLEFVVISGYAEFSYAQKALNFGVAGYCLKPVEDADIQGVLTAVRERLDKRYDRRVDYFSALEFMTDDMADQKLSASDIGMHWDAQQGMRVLICVGRWDAGKGRLWNVVMPLGVDRKACFVSDGDLEQAVQELTLQIGLVVGVSRVVHDVSLVNNAIVEAQIAANQSFMTGRRGIFYYQSSSRGPLREVLNQLVEALEMRETAQVMDVFDKISEMMESGTYNIRHAFYVYNQISDMLFQRGLEDDLYDLINYEELTQLFGNVTEMLTALQEQCLSIINYGTDLDVQAVSNDVVREILKYLHDNYYQDISLRELADQYYLNPSYLCRTFKKQVGKPFTVYLANLRLRHACELLRATTLSVYEIAERCGYKDYFYFARLFKRMLGITPSQYRAGEEGTPAALV